MCVQMYTLSHRQESAAADGVDDAAAAATVATCHVALYLTVTAHQNIIIAGTLAALRHVAPSHSHSLFYL